MEFIVRLVALTVIMSGCSPANVSRTRQQDSQIAATPAAPTEQAFEPASIKVTQVVQGRVDDVIWSSDGASIFYLIRRVDTDAAYCGREWKRLDLQSMQTEKAADAPNRISEALELAWMGKTIQGQQVSPGQDRVLYLRTPQGYSPPDPLPPMYIAPRELWSAGLDGSNPTRLWEWGKECTYIWQVEWFSDGQKATVVCGNEGVFGRVVVNVNGSRAQTFDSWIGTPDEQDLIGIHAVPAYIVQVSPDNSKVAFTEGNGELWISFLETHATQEKVAELGFWPQWSADGERVYYLSIDSSSPRNVPNIVVYNLCDKTHRVVLDKDVLGGVDAVFQIGLTDKWMVSPNEDAILVRTSFTGGIWLIQWR